MWSAPGFYPRFSTIENQVQYSDLTSPPKGNYNNGVRELDYYYGGKNFQ